METDLADNDIGKICDVMRKLYSCSNENIEQIKMPYFHDISHVVLALF